MEFLIQYMERHPVLTFFYAMLFVMLLDSVVRNLAEAIKMRKTICTCWRKKYDADAD